MRNASPVVFPGTDKTLRTCRKRNENRESG
jgi:hypothetical protein